MPFKNKEKAKDYSKKWRAENIESIKARRKIYFQENKKACYERHKNWIENNKEHVNDYYKKWSRKNMLNAKKNKSCVLCGYKEFPQILEFHHLDPKEKLRCVKPAKSGMLKEEMDKCDLLCPNCHALFHYKERTKQ